MTSTFRQFEQELRADRIRFGKEWADELWKAREIILQRKQTKASVSVATKLGENGKVPPLNTPGGAELQIISLDKDTFKRLNHQFRNRHKGRHLPKDTRFMLNGHSVKDLEPRPFAHSPLWCKVHDRWFSEC